MNVDVQLEQDNNDNRNKANINHEYPAEDIKDNIDNEQAKIKAFIQDEDDDEDDDESDINNDMNQDQLDIDHSNKSKKKKILNKIGSIFKKKSKSRKNSKSNNNDINHHNFNNNNNNFNNNDIVSSPMSAAQIPNINAMAMNGFNDGYNDEYGQYGQQITHNLNSNEQEIISKVGGDLPWNCEKCTFLNEATELHCTMCFYARFEVKNLPAQWQWKAADRWITYGIPETTEIEEAYKSGAKEVSLSKGWFASNPNLYKIYFDKQHGDKKSKHKSKKNKRKSGHNDDQYHEFDENSTYFYQINGDTGTRREVRRIGTDDDNLFNKITLDSLDVEDRKCTICCYEFTSKEESDGLIVQLSTCKGHGFHKECIAQWVQLKGNCPLCRIDVS